MHTDINGFYAMLDVAPTASPHAIRAAFRFRAKTLHPDINPDRAPEFIALKRAYDTLSNPDARAAYDRACSTPGEPSPAADQPAPRRRASAGAPPPSPPPPRRRGVVSAYAFALTLMGAISILFVGLLVDLAGAPPSPPSASIADTFSGERGSRAARPGATDGRESDGSGSADESGSAERSEPGDGALGASARPDSSPFHDGSASARRRPSASPAARPSDSHPSW